MIQPPVQDHLLLKFHIAVFTSLKFVSYAKNTMVLRTKHHLEGNQFVRVMRYFYFLCPYYYLFIIYQ